MCKEGFNCDMIVKGGIHLTNGAYLPTNIIKEVTATEEGYHSGAINWNFLFSASHDKLNTEQDRIYKQVYHTLYLNKTGTLII